MTRRTNIVEQVGAYFASKGKVLTADEYKAAEDVPIRFQLVKRVIGSWSRLINMIGDIEQYDGTALIEPATPKAPEPEAPAPVEEAPKEEEVAPAPKTSEKQK
jgi:hypothetical protein